MQSIRFQYQLLIFVRGNTSLIMSADFIAKDEEERNRQIDHTKWVVDIKSSHLSEHGIVYIKTGILRRICSENRIESNVNYDQICGPWSYPENPAFKRYTKLPVARVCVWEYFSKEDISHLKKYQDDKKMILSIFEKKFLSTRDETLSKECILTKLLWEFFKVARKYSFTEYGTSGLLGIVYLTQLYFLSNPWIKPKEIYNFFREIVLLHSVLNPPECMNVFTLTECQLILKAFHGIYMENLVLLRILCHTNYHFLLNFNNYTNSDLESY